MGGITTQDTYALYKLGWAGSGECEWEGEQHRIHMHCTNWGGLVQASVNGRENNTGYICTVQTGVGWFRRV